MTVVHAYIADLNRERREVESSTGQLIVTHTAYTAVCGEHLTVRADLEVRCFGRLRLRDVWPLAGSHVTCPACRSEIRRLLAERDSPEREERIRALTKWAREHPLACVKGDLEARATLERQRAYRAAKKKERAARFKLASPSDRTRCRYCEAPMRSSKHTTCGRGTCRARLATELRKAREGR